MNPPIFLINIEQTEPSSIVLGLSSLYYMATGSFVFDSPFKFAVPDNLIRLIERAEAGSQEHSEFLVRIVLEDHEDKEQLSAQAIVASLRSIFADLEGARRLVSIDEDMVDSEIEEALVGCFEDDNYNISLSPKRNFVRDYFARALSWSKNTGALIIETTKKKFVELGTYIASLQLPDKADAFIKNKQEFINRVFSFRGGKWTKWFIGASISVAGFSHPAFGAVGVGIAFMDP